MENIMKNIAENKLFFSLVCFFAFIIFVYIPCMYLWLWFKNKKAAAFAKQNNAVKCYIKHTKINDILTVHSINGKKPVMFSTFSKIGCYVLQGENSIYVYYMWQPFWANLVRKISSTHHLFGIKQHHIDGKNLQVFAKANTEYELYYDHKKHKYVFAEK
jgi:hypothetical protein